MPQSTVNSTEHEVENEDGSTRTIKQYKTTVPKGLAEAMRLDGAKLDWEVKSGNTFEVSVVARDDDE